MFKKITIILLWILSILSGILFSYENPEKIESIIHYFKSTEGDIEANSFKISFKPVYLFENGYRTAFVSYADANDEFDKKKLKIYFQDGGIFEDSNYKEPIFEFLTNYYNGGVKSIFNHKNNKFAFMSSSKDDCLYASIVSLQTNSEIFKTKCLPAEHGTQETYVFLTLPFSHILQLL